jgi:hypothetical protein
MKIFKRVKEMDEFDKAAAKGFFLGIAIASLLAAYPFYLFMKVLILKWGF